ncbi:hypothetical protein FZ983_32305 [Azospirillum sp. B21]|uniref:hypothetical protein n=1 Tax=Azospirillum sp. B21 TaxID=2607496 RepID=UPI0011EC685A|nr:hypothetical protein [Azospirillum sp. B21]KAA0572255.1 hypothetical protein FZ983_32305 [Azospirillum sp. B21]
MTADTTTALLPCPMCDTPTSFGRVTYDPCTVREQEWTQDTFHYVNCPACGVKNHGVVGFKTQEEAAAAWNRRAAPASPSAAQPDALKDERDLSKALMDLLKEMHEAPTMTAGYEVLADFTAQAGLGVPVPLRSAQPDAEERGVSDLPPGLVLVATPYRNAPDKWMLIELTAPGRAKVITGGCIETEAEGIAHAHNFAGEYAARASAPEVEGDWKPISEAPQNGMIDVRSTCTYRWRAYRPGSPQLRRGIKGRWQRATDYGWENANLPENGEWKPVEITRGAAIRSAGEGK